jgi:hypothetical protein
MQSQVGNRSTGDSANKRLQRFRTLDSRDKLGNARIHAGVLCDQDARRDVQCFRVRYTEWARRDGREAEGGGLLNRYRAKSSIEGSNPSLSARQSAPPIHSAQNNPNAAVYAANLLVLATPKNLGRTFSQDLVLFSHGAFLSRDSSMQEWFRIDVDELSIPEGRHALANAAVVNSE